MDMFTPLGANLNTSIRSGKSTTSCPGSQGPLPVIMGTSSDTDGMVAQGLSSVTQRDRTAFTHDFKHNCSKRTHARVLN